MAQGIDLLINRTQEVSFALNPRNYSLVGSQFSKDLDFYLTEVWSSYYFTAIIIKRYAFYKKKL
jgi:hypothetical protein